METSVRSTADASDSVPITEDDDCPENAYRPRLLLMGLRRSGKSSIQKVVFHKLSANETLFLESTSRVQKDNIVSFIEFQVWDVPGRIDISDPGFDSETIFAECGALIYVIDSQDDYMDALANLVSTVSRAYRINPDLNFEVFVHKVDGLSDDYKIETQRDIQMRVSDELSDFGLNDVLVSFHLTSIYDHSIFEAFSRVVQKLIPQLPTLENLLNILCLNSGIEKVFLFDVASKIYIATDSSPVDMQSYEICSDMIDVILDISNVYGYPTLAKVETTVNDETTSLSELDQPITSPTRSAISTALVPKEIGDRRTKIKHKRQAYSIIKLNNSMVLYLREVNKFLALVCLLRAENFEKHGLLDYNFYCFNDALKKIFELRNLRHCGHQARESLH